MQRTKTKNVHKKLFKFHFQRYSFPKRLQNDNGSQFKNKEWIRKLETHNITLIFNPLYFSKTNMAERPVRGKLKGVKRTYCSKELVQMPTNY